MKIAIIIILIIFLLSLIKNSQIYEFNKLLTKKNINDINYNTGDIIFFRHDCPLYFYGDNGINMDIHIFKNMCKTLFHFIQPWFSHCGIVVIRNNTPYVLHITADDNYDNYTGNNTIGTPTLTSLCDLYKYKGMLYHNSYIGPPIKNIESILEEIYSENIKLDGNILNAFIVNLLGISKHKEKTMVCCDFVLYVMVKFGISDKFEYCDLNHINDICKNNKNYVTKKTIIKSRLFNCLR